MIDKEGLKITNPELYKVAFEKGTEAPYSGSLLKETARGTYNCAVCQNPLFNSDAKFHSEMPGTAGWPSFDEALPGSVEYLHDNSHGMNRTEVVCSNCKAHLGHLFDDGEAKTGKHFCMNSICLDLNKNNYE